MRIPQMLRACQVLRVDPFVVTSPEARERLNPGGCQFRRRDPFGEMSCVYLATI